MSWEPAVANYPALLCNAPLTIGINNLGISETAAGGNMNPAGTPYRFSGGATNNDSADKLPSEINGIIYSSSDLTFETHPVIRGVVIAAGAINVNASILDVYHDPRYAESPPPGFRNVNRKPLVVAGSFRQVVR
jgi:hypothetical protein